MGEVVNLRQARKRLARTDAVAQANANRRKFGRTRAERDADIAERAYRERLLDGARIDRGDAETHSD